MGSNTTFQNTAPLSNKTIRAGEYVAIGYDMQGISQQQLENTKTTLEQAKTKLEHYQTTQEETALAGITKHDITGAMMQAGVQSYFAINQAQDTIAAKQAGNVIKNHYMSYGSFATYVHPNQRYGMIFGASAKGMQMDIDQLMYTAVSKDNDRETLTNFLMSQGPRESANEHLIPEQLFDDPNTEEKEVEGVSAVKALQIAASQGQTIYTITRENYAEILPKLQLQGSTLTDINNAMWAGRVVTVHENSISYKGWRGDGYSIVDPNTGAGAYLINGGANGGFLNYMGDNATGFAFALGITSILATLGPVGLPVMLALITLTFVVAMLVTMATNLMLIENQCPDELVILNSVLNMAGFLLTSFLKGIGQVIAGSIANFIYNSIVPSAAPLCRYR